MNRSLQTVHMDFAQDDLPIRRCNRLDSNGRRPNGCSTWTSRATSSRSITRVTRLRRSLPSGDPFDSEYKSLYYCRYADDFSIGIIGSRADAEAVRQKVKAYIEHTLKLTIAPEKSHIRPSRQGVIFLG